MPGLSAQVEVFRDEYGVPQIYADNAEDLFEAQGFVHAQDRFYEMDFRRHMTAGRLSELFGASQVETDTYIRTLGWRRVAEQELGCCRPAPGATSMRTRPGSTRTCTAGRPPTCPWSTALLGLQGRDYTPGDWTAADSLAWLKAMAWDLGSNMDSETERADDHRAGRSARAAEL